MRSSAHWAPVHTMGTLSGMRGSREKSGGVRRAVTHTTAWPRACAGLIDDDGMVEIKCPLACDKLGQVWASPETAHLEYSL